MEEKRPKVIIVHESHDYNSSYGGAGVDSWTPDSQAILFTSSRNGRAEVFRKGLNENIDEALVRGPESYWATWMGLAPDDSPLSLRDIGSQDVYSLDWQAM